MAKGHEHNTEQLILSAAYELFFSLGYKQTTIRKIIQKAGVKNGSLYHYYTGKDDIFSHLITELLDICRQRAKELTGGSEDPVLTYCVDTALKIQIITSYPVVSELIGEAFSSWDSMKGVLSSAVEKDIQLFSAISPGLTLEECYLREVVAFGCLRGLVQASYYQKIPYSTLIRYQFTTILHLFGLEPDRVEAMIRQSTRLIEESANYNIFEYARTRLQGMKA
ncbi:MAG: TetR/AcrR family transcriptional regulator [Sphaerochaetaceae bacterium]|nr:TetR/AcrR family transcriptional regulator [Sphaerochaetaceae bacterium]